MKVSAVSVDLPMADTIFCSKRIGCDTDDGKILRLTI